RFQAHCRGHVAPAGDAADAEANCQAPGPRWGRGMIDRSRPLGLVAGAGRLPVVFAGKTRQLGLPLVCIGLHGMAGPALENLAAEFTWCNVAKLGRMIRILRRGGVQSYVMAGKVHKTRIIGSTWRVWRLAPDLRMLRMWYGRRRDNRDDSILLDLI